MLSLHEESVVVVIGPPGSGKSKVGNLLAESSGLPLYSTEELTTGNKALTALKTIMHLCGDEGFIMEGMIGYRWLRKHKEMELPCPDIVIQLDASDEEIEDAMSKRDKHCNTKLIRKFRRRTSQGVDTRQQHTGCPSYQGLRDERPLLTRSFSLGSNSCG
jgi:energy-coupling factor transporter ATP-binding protein EcfA2